MASIRRRKTAKGETRYSVRWRDAAGPRREDALRIRVEVERRQALGALYQARGEAFGVALDDFLARHAMQVRPSTMETLTSVARGVDPIRGLRVEDVSADVVQRLVAAKAATAPARAGALLKLVRLVLSDCERRGLVVDTRVRHVKAPRQAEARRAYLEWVDVERLVDAVPHPDDAAAVLLTAGCGLRWQECFALTAADVADDRVVVRRAIDRDGRAGQVKAPASRRTIPIPTRVRDAVRWTAARNAAGPLFPNRRGRSWSAAAWHMTVWDPARDATGIRVRWHDLRHTYAAHLVAAGVHPKTMQRLLGHSAISVTLDTYGHLFPEALDEAVEALDRVIGERVRAQSGDGATRV